MLAAKRTSSRARAVRGRSLVPRYPGVGAALGREVPGRHRDSLVLEDWGLLSVSRKGAMSWATCTAALSRGGAETVRTHLGMWVPAGRASHIWRRVVCGSCVQEELAVAGVH